MVGPLFVLQLPISALKHYIRKRRASKSRDADSFVEVEAFTLISTARTDWRWTSVLEKCFLLGLGYFVLEAVVMTMTTMFLAWLNMQLASVHIAGICVIIIVIALCLFAIPVVPGVPAYLACGVTIGAAGEKAFGSFTAALLLAVFIAGISKLLACLMQQKLFGQVMGNSVRIRSMVGVNSKGIKAIKLILEQPGMSRAKVAILVGGPDWPTSVLTGILKLPTAQMQLGVLPVLIPIAFTVMTGGAMLKTGAFPNSLWSPFSAVFTTLSAITLGGSGLFAVSAMDKVIKEREEEIEAMPNDEQVEEYERQAELVKMQKQEAMLWARQSTAWRVVLILAVFLMDVSSWIFQLSSSCFHNVVMTSDINAHPFNGNFLNVFRPHGWMGLAFQAGAWFFYGLCSTVSFTIL